MTRTVHARATRGLDELLGRQSAAGRYFGISLTHLAEQPSPETGVPVVAVLGRLVDLAVAAARAKRAVGFAAAVAAGVLAVVALFSEQAVELAVTAVVGQLAARRAAFFGRAIRRQVHAVVAVFLRHLLDAVAAVGAALALGGAAAVRGIVIFGAVVARFARRLGAVAANRGALAFLASTKPVNDRRKFDASACRSAWNKAIS